MQEVKLVGATLPGDMLFSSVLFLPSLMLQGLLHVSPNPWLVAPPSSPVQVPACPPCPLSQWRGGSAPAAARHGQTLPPAAEPPPCLVTATGSLLTGGSPFASSDHVGMQRGAAVPQPARIHMPDPSESLSPRERGPKSQHGKSRAG